MTTYALRRLAALVPTLFALSLFVFLVVEWIPGDPARAVLGERASAEALKAERARLGLDKPLPVRYLLFIKGVATCDLGRSVRTGRPVMEELLRYLPATAELSAFAMILAVVLGVTGGVIAAANRNSAYDYGIMLAALVGVSMPIFWLGLMLALFFQRGAMALGFAGWPASARLSALIDLPYRTGLLTLDALLSRDMLALKDVLIHLLLPAVTLATIPVAIIARMTRSSLLEVLSQDYIRTARAKGLSERIVRWRHALKNALVPVVTVVGLQFGSLLGGAIITETIFAWPGLGKWILDAVLFRDFRVIQGGTLFMAAAFISVNLVVDLLYGWLDPRIHYR